MGKSSEILNDLRIKPSETASSDNKPAALSTTDQAFSRAISESAFLKSSDLGSFIAFLRKNGIATVSPESRFPISGGRLVLDLDFSVSVPSAEACIGSCD